MKQKYKVLVLSKHLNLGGAERLLIDAMPYLDRQQFEYHFAYLLSDGNYLAPQFEAQNFPVHCLGMLSNYHFPLMLPRLHGLQQHHQFDLIHAHLPLPGILARIIGRWYKIPVIYTEHNLPERQHPITRWVSKTTYGWNTQVLAVSQGVFDSIIQLGWDEKTNVHALLNGIPVEQIRAEACHLDDLRRELSIPEGHLIVGTVAVFSRQKRLEDWLEVARQVAKQREDVTFLLVGYGPEDAALRNRVETLGLTTRVIMPGFRPDSRRLMGLMDVYLMSSEFEGLPIALLEAMILAKPVVATNVSGISEAVESGKEGFLAPVGAVAELSHYVVQLLNSPTLHFELGQCGAKKAEANFHLKDRVQFIEDIYLELLPVADCTQ